METRQDVEIQRKLAALTALALNYGKDFPKPLVKTWVRLLAEYDAGQVERGVDRVIASYGYKTLPPFAVLNKAIMETSGIMEQDEAQGIAALSEWENLLKAAAKYGRYNQPALDERTERVIRLMGGWDAVCDWETSKLEWKQKEFFEHWQKIAEHGQTIGLPASNILALSCGKTAREQAESARKAQGVVHIGGTVKNALNGLERAG